MNPRTSIVNAFRDGLLLQLACYAAGIATLVLGIRKLPEIATTERDLFFGVLLVTILSLLMILFGLVLQLHFGQQKRLNAKMDDAA